MSNSPQVTIGVILFKGEKYLKYSLGSLVNQDYKNVEFLVRDQSPNGEAYEYVMKEIPEIVKKVTMEKGSNLWHSGGHNALINKMKGKYYFCCSNDMLYPKDFVSRMVTEMEKPENKRFGSATCKLMQWNFEEAERGNLEASKTGNIDSFGIGITKGHQFYDIGQGESDQTPYLSLKEIFGPSGALSVFRKEALEDIAYKKPDGTKEYYDELLHYKNDVDLAYRLQWAGHHSLFFPTVTVYHDRQVGSDSSNMLGRFTSHKNKSKWARGNSLFGHLVTVKKNYTKDFSLGVRFRTALMGMVRHVHTSMLDAELLDQYNQVDKFRNEIRLKAAAICRRVPASEIEKFMC